MPVPVHQILSHLYGHGKRHEDSSTGTIHDDSGISTSATAVELIEGMPEIDNLTLQKRLDDLRNAKAGEAPNHRDERDTFARNRRNHCPRKCAAFVRVISLKGHIR